MPLFSLVVTRSREPSKVASMAMTPTTISTAATITSTTVMPRSSERSRSTTEVPHEEAVVDDHAVRVAVRALALRGRLDVHCRVGRVAGAVRAVGEDGRPARAGLVDEPSHDRRRSALTATAGLVAHALPEWRAPPPMAGAREWQVEVRAVNTPPPPHPA